MKRRTSVREDDRIDVIPEYGRQKLLAYAESFRDLADLFEESREKDKNLRTGRNISAGGACRKARSFWRSI
mgnify:CR=1 FL=1